MGEYRKNQVDEKIREIKEQRNLYEIGLVTAVTEYILTVKGLEHAAYMERVMIGGSAEGYVNSIRPTDLCITVVRSSAPIHVGDQVVGTGRPYQAMFSPSGLSHVVDMFGNDRIQDGVFEDAVPIEVENPTIPIMDRGTVNRPLETGIAGIDLIYPIGKGQRQLIIGDKKTGKTQIALDTIANQRGKNMICIYVAIGKTKKNIRKVYQELLARDCMRDTMILAAFHDDTPPVLYLTPYVAASIAEHYMMAGRDVLLVLDDLKCHADVHREISLLLGHVPGREAYPPDIFYTHSRLLERGCQHKNGGSITVLPLVETRGGDITGYISTNIISITDGQIVLSKKNFDKGQKPAIHYGLSVSRLGGAVQEEGVKRLGAKVRRELLSYLETREVYEMANMDEMGREMQERLKRGANLLNGLIQYKYQPLSPAACIARFTAIMENGAETAVSQAESADYREPEAINDHPEAADHQAPEAVIGQPEPEAAGSHPEVSDHREPEDSTGQPETLDYQEPEAAPGQPEPLEYREPAIQSEEDDHEHS